jgi:amino acid adenylation domain-containing protein
VTFRTRRLLHDSLLFSAEQRPGDPAVVADGAELTYEEFLHAALRLASALQELGLRRGDRVAIYMENSVACATAIYGTLLAGGVFIVVNPQTKADKLAYILNDSEASYLFAEGAISRVAQRASAEAPSVRATIAANRPAELDGAIGFEELVAGADPSPAVAATVPVDLAALIYTSGSTGEPKGVMMTHASMLFASESIAEYLRLSPEHRILSVLPLAFDYGLYQLLMSMRVGATLILERSFAYPAQVVKALREHRATVFPGVPTVYATLLSMHERSPLSFPDVERLTNTAADLPAAFHDPLREMFPNALIFRMYGLTECKRVSYLEPELLDSKPMSVGKAIPGTETVVLDTEGRPVAPGETGVLHVRGPHVMAGYWRQPELTAHMLREGNVPGERMLCTHDFFTVDEEGFLYFVGRSDDIIKTRGEKVSPIEVENALYAIPGIREAAVLGAPDDLLGEAVHAYVALEDGAELTPQAIVAACRTRLESFMVPTEVFLVDELPKTETGKIRKQSLREQGSRV